MDQPTEIAIELLNETQVLRKTIKKLMRDQLMMNDALLVLNPSEAVQYVMDTVPSIRRLVDELTENNNLLNEHLDYFFPMQTMNILIYK